MEFLNISFRNIDGKKMVFLDGKHPSPKRYQQDLINNISQVSLNSPDGIFQYQKKKTIAFAQRIPFHTKGQKRYALLIHGQRHHPTLVTDGNTNTTNLTPSLKNAVLKAKRNYNRARANRKLENAWNAFSNKQEWIYDTRFPSLRFLKTNHSSADPTPSINVQKLWRAQVAYKKIVNEDLDRKRKSSHWAWYVFPHNREGKSDQHRVRINKNNHIQAWIAVHNNPLKNWWSNTLNRVSKKAGGYKGFMKPIDINRVNTFIKEWSGHLQSWDKQGLSVNPKFRNALNKMAQTTYTTNTTKTTKTTNTTNTTNTTKKRKGRNTDLPSSSATSLLSYERKNMLQVGYEISQLGLLPGIALAGNTGRFGGAAIGYIPVGHRAGHRITKTDQEEDYESTLINTLKPDVQKNVRYKNNHYYPEKIHPNHTTQEEAVISNIWETCKDNKDKQLLHPDGTLKVPWGLVHPMREVNRRGSKLTFQKVDYTSSPDYGKAFPLNTRASYQEFGKPWDLSKSYDCVLVVTAGPNNGNKGRSKWSSQTRTIDPKAEDYEYFKGAIVNALVATLKVMKEQRVDVAILPGISTGLYAGGHKDQIATDYMDLVRQAINRIGDLSPIQKVVYCNNK